MIHLQRVCPHSWKRSATARGVNWPLIYLDKMHWPDSVGILTPYREIPRSRRYSLHGYASQLSTARQHFAGGLFSAAGSAQCAQDRVDIGPPGIFDFRIPRPHHALSVEHQDNWMRDTVIGGARGMPLVQEPERPDDFRFRVGQQRKTDFPPLGEARQLRDRIVTYRCDPIAPRGEFIIPFVPDDRLGLTVNSPIERPGEQKDQSFLAGHRRKIHGLAALVRRIQPVRDRLADLGTAIQLVRCADRSGRIYRTQEYGSGKPEARAAHEVQIQDGNSLFNIASHTR